MSPLSACADPFLPALAGISASPPPSLTPPSPSLLKPCAVLRKFLWTPGSPISSSSSCSQLHLLELWDELFGAAGCIHIFGSSKLGSPLQPPPREGLPLRCMLLMSL
ncbi:unnamed protein product [Urochloa humidicola]